MHATFSPSKRAKRPDRKAISEALGSLPFELPPQAAVLVERTYGGARHAIIIAPEKNLVDAIVEGCDLSEPHRSRATDQPSLQRLREFVDAEQSAPAGPDKLRPKDAKNIREQIDTVIGLINTRLPDGPVQAILKRLPRFFYFSEYSMLKGRIDLNALLGKNPAQMAADERTALSLLQLASASGKEFQVEEFEHRVSELEAAANLITQEVFKYWTTNQNLVVQFVGDAQTVMVAPNQPQVVHRFLDIRLNDLTHQVTTNLERRSSGFRWFFSFIAAFSEYERMPEKMVVLLDEPGLTLHGKAQNDFVRFINERLAGKNQVIYTSHSPFMVEPTKLQRVRLVEDLTTRENPDVGAKITTDVLTVQGDTLFPLQAALGYDLAQNLFAGKYNVIVEGPSDFVYLTVLSEYLRRQSRTPLDPRWRIAPVGGADKIPSFVALLGTHLDVTVLMDASGHGAQRLLSLAKRGILAKNRILSVDMVTGNRGDIEDLFSEEEYLALFNWAYNASVHADMLIGSDPIVPRLEWHIGNRFDHLPPAYELLRRRDEFFSAISTNTVDRFERLFKLINETLTA